MNPYVENNDSIFLDLFARMNESGCSKKQIVAGTLVNGELRYATNHCVYAESQCPRLELPTGVGYELCTAVHAEINLIAKLKQAGEASDGIVWVAGHYYACIPCADALKAFGIKEIRVREFNA